MSTNQIQDSNNSSRNSSPARLTANQCIRCNKAIGRKLSQKCGTCFKPAHLQCMPEWADLNDTNELNHVIKRPGLVWYCPRCHPTLAEYFPAPGVKTALEGVDKKLENIALLLSENSKITKSFAQVTAEQREAEEEARAATLRIEERYKRESNERERSERKQSAVLHNIPEDGNTHDIISGYLQDLGFDNSQVDSISRIGRRSDGFTREKVRPIKIKFVSEVFKIDFLGSYNSWSERENTFATPDLNKEEQQKEYKLRCLRRNLKSRNESSRYRVRNGELQQQYNGSWVTLDEEGNLPTPLRVSTATSNSGSR